MKALSILVACALLGATGAASAATITVSWTQTVGGSTQTLVGPIVSLSIMPRSRTVDFVQPIDTLSPTISRDVSAETLVHELDITDASSSDIITLAFQNVLFTSFSTSFLNQTDDVSFAYANAKETITFTATSATPLPAALPLFATGLGALGLLGWLRKRKSRAAVA
jgi:type VI protein secretion system component Hcp